MPVWNNRDSKAKPDRQSVPMANIDIRYLFILPGCVFKQIQETLELFKCSGQHLLIYRPAETDNNTSNSDMEAKESDFTIVNNNLLIDAVSTSVDQVDFNEFKGKNPLLGYNFDNVKHDIIEYLGRPIICPVGNVAWTTSQVQGTNLFTMDVPGSMFNSGTIWGDKLTGLLGMKGTFCFKVQFNCQRFQQGIALVSVLPASSHISTIRRALVESNIVYKSQLPSIRYNVGELDEVEIKVPFISPELFYNRTARLNWATVYMDVYSQLAGANLNGVCWCWFEDVELFHATAQSGFTSKTKNKRRVAFQDQEDSGNSGIISQPLSTFSQAFAQVATNIPLLSAVAAPTAWFLAAASKAASAFGFSSTVITETRKALIHKSLPHMNNCDTNDTSDSMGLTVANKIAHMPGFAGTDIDEMSLQYIVQIPAYVGTFNWANTDVYSTNLRQIVVHPLLSNISNVVTPTVGSAITTFTFAPCGYVATDFMYWRGSLKYRFFINKTDFHTGRLCFQFAPSNALTASNVLANAHYVYKWIWDIADSHSFEIVVPYVSSTPWMSTGLNANYSTGSLCVFVLTALNAPPTVSSSVNIVYEMCGGEDFEVAGCNTNEYFTPIIAYSGIVNKNHVFRHREPYHDDQEITPRILSSRRKTRAIARGQRRWIKKFNHDLIEAQGPLSVEQDNSKMHISVPSIEPGHAKHDLNSFNALYTIGESVKSIRQILKRSAVVYTEKVTTGTDFCVLWNPFVPYIGTTFQGGAQVLFTNNRFADYYTKYTSMFALRRGGVIIRTITSGDGISHATLQSAANGLFGFTKSGTGSLNNHANATDSRVITANQSQGALDVLVPYYSRTASSPVQHLSAFDTTLTDTRYYVNHVKMYNYASTNQSTRTITNFILMRQVADDFSLGGFLGTIPLYGAIDDFP